MSWSSYIGAAQTAGFSKATIIARANYQSLAKTSDSDIATAWKDGDTAINENQELLDSWIDKKKRCFCFYGAKFNIVLREPDDEEDCAIVCIKGNEILCARQFKTIWFVAYGVKQKMKMEKKKKKKKDGDDGKDNQEEVKVVKPTGFSGAQGAYTAICGGVWDALEEAGV